MGGLQLLGDLVTSATQTLPKELSQAMEMGRGKKSSFTWAVCLGKCYRQRKLTQGDSTVVSEKAWLLVGGPCNPSPPCQGYLMGWRPAFLTLSEDGARPGTGHCGKVQSRVGPWEFRQAQLLFVAPATPRQSDFRLCHFDIHSDREGQYFPPRNTLLFPQYLVLYPIQALPGPLSFCPVYSIAEPGDTQQWFHSACHFPGTGSIGQEALKQLQPIFYIKFPQLSLPPLLGRLHLKLQTLTQRPPPPGSLP